MRDRRDVGGGGDLILANEFVVGGKSLRSKSGVELKLKVWMSKLEIRANSDQSGSAVEDKQ